MTRIAVVTFSRAEYGLIRWILQDIESDPALELQLIVSGTHLEKSFGLTIDEIHADGFKPAVKIPLNISGDGSGPTSEWMARALMGMTEALESLQPDILVITGDRIEMLAAAQAAMLTRVPIAHIHGGEVTAGALDDGVRHALTKLSHVHFAATPEYGRRLAQLGESPTQIHVVGSPGLCALTREQLLDRSSVSNLLGIPTTDPYLLVTYQPVTARVDQSVRDLEELLKALATLLEFRIVFTGINADPGSTAIRDLITAFVTDHPRRAKLIESFGHTRYLSALKFASACVGNSSSGIIEAPALGVPTVNIGDRQLGRSRAGTIADVPGEALSITTAIRNVTKPSYLASTFPSPLPYGGGGASRRIVEVLKHTSPEGLLTKTFVDCPNACPTWQGYEL